MSLLSDILLQQLAGGTLKQISKQIDADEESTNKAISIALPILMSALAKNSSKEDGAKALANAISKDHDGSVLDNVLGFISNFENGPGNGILKHVLGAKRKNVESEISKSSGLDIGKVSKLLIILAPLAMGALGKIKKEKNLDVMGLVNLLNNERKDTEKKASSGLGSLLNLIDADDDGSVVDDITGIGKNIFNKFLGSDKDKGKKK